MAKVWADAGHGGADPGAVDGTANDRIYTEEEDRNLDIALRFMEAMRRCGVAVKGSRVGDVGMSLSARTSAANAWGADLLVSFHCNGGPDGATSRGIEVFHYPGSTQGAKAASAVYRHLEAVSPWKDRGVKTANFHMLRESAMPAILVEYGFVNNTEEEAALASPAYRLALAEATARGVCEYLGVRYVAEEAPLIAIPQEPLVYRINVMWAEDPAAMKRLTDKADALGLRYAADGPAFYCHANTDKTKALEGLVAGDPALHRMHSIPRVPQDVYTYIGVADGIGARPWKVTV